MDATKHFAMLGSSGDLPKAVRHALVVAGPKPPAALLTTFVSHLANDCVHVTVTEDTER